jgi:hypothetical protein
VLDLLDALLLPLWRLCCLIGDVVRRVWAGVARLAFGGGRRRETGLGRFLRSVGLLSLGEFMAESWDRIADRIDRSASARRVFFVVVALLLCLWWYPPSSWGPWHHYQRGVASHYGVGFYFRRTANGEWFYPGKICAAHNQLPLGTTIKVINRDNGQSLVLRVADRGPFVDGRILDLSTAAAKRLGITGPGTVEVDIYTHRAIRP